jgi:carbamoyl-phosphate synthase large subunit
MFLFFFSVSLYIYISMYIYIHTYIHTYTYTHRWFLSKLEYMALLSNDMSQYTIDTLPKNMMVLAKKAGFSDKQIAGM